MRIILTVFIILNLITEVNAFRVTLNPASPKLMFSEILIQGKVVRCSGKGFNFFHSDQFLLRSNKAEYNFKEILDFVFYRIEHYKEFSGTINYCDDLPLIWKKVGNKLTIECKERSMKMIDISR